jgi:osmoprotectant transport system ATP-binding protein
MPGEKTNIIQFRDVRFTVGEQIILKDLSLNIARGEVITLLGESGCGKTTTLKLINRLIDPTSGEVRVEGRSTLDWDPIELRRHIGYVLQDGGLFPHLTVRENVGITLKLLDREPSETDERSNEMLSLVGLDPAKFANRYPHELSGGQRQRVGVARALVSDPSIVLLDEPFGALDVLTRTALQREFARIVADLGKTAVFVTHDLNEARMLATRIALMERGSIVFLGSPAEFSHSDHPLAQAYLAAIQDPAATA